MSNDERSDSTTPAGGTPAPGGDSPGGDSPGGGILPSSDGWPVDYPAAADTAAGESITEPVEQADGHPFAEGAPQDPEPPQPGTAPAEDWQQRYQSEHKKSRILMVAAAVAALLFAGTLAYAAAQTNDPGSGRFGPVGERFEDGFGPRGGHGGPGGPGGRHGGPGWDDDGLYDDADEGAESGDDADAADAGDDDSGYESDDDSTAASDI